MKKVDFVATEWYDKHVVLSEKITDFVGHSNWSLLSGLMSFLEKYTTQTYINFGSFW
jgi:hypothetical protein